MVLSFIKEFGSLINTGLIFLILAAVGLLYKLFVQTISKKDATIELLQQQSEKEKVFSVDNVVQKFRSLKEYYEVHVSQWYDNSISQLKEEKRNAVEDKERELTRKIEEEMRERQGLKKRYDTLIKEGNTARIKAENIEICGVYTVVGSFPRGGGGGYFGKLQIQRRGELYSVDWSIGKGAQHLEGVGFTVGNTFSVLFKETSRGGLAPESDYIGIVTYEMVTSDIMSGYWTAFGAELLGFEECRKEQNIQR